jgi:hypothetical protein
LLIGLAVCGLAVLAYRVRPACAWNFHFGSRKWGLAASPQTGWPRETASLAAVPVPISDGASG